MIAAAADVGHESSGAPPGLHLGGLYAPPRCPVLVDVPALTYLAVDGVGALEGSPALAEAVGALRAAAPPDRATGPVEVLHTGDGHWTVLLAVRVGRAAPGEPSPAGTISPGVRRLLLHERWVAQVLHTGAHAGQESGWRRLERFVADRGYLTDGPRHEIVLDADGTRRRILRHAVRPGRTD